MRTNDRLLAEAMDSLATFSSYAAIDREHKVVTTTKADIATLCNARDKINTLIVRGESALNSSSHS